MESINSQLTKAKVSIAHYIKGVRFIDRYASVHLNKNTETYKQHQNEILQCHHQHRVLLGRSNAGTEELFGFFLKFKFFEFHPMKGLWTGTEIGFRETNVRHVQKQRERHRCRCKSDARPRIADDNEC